MGNSPSYPRVDLTGRTALVTGANTGIGYETAKALAGMGCNVTVACRSEQRGLAAIQRMRDELPDQTLELEFSALDLGSLEATKSFAEQYAASHTSLHLLVMNAGCAMPAIGGTGDGYESQYQINFLSHFLMTLLLMPLLQNTVTAMAEEPAAPSSDTTASDSSTTAEEAASPPPAAAAVKEVQQATREVRVIHVSSTAHTLGKLDLDVQAPAEGTPGSMQHYNRSKFYQVLIANYQHRHFNRPGLAFHSLHPGMVKTELARDFTGAWKHISGALNGMGQLKTPEEGARTTLSACVDPRWDGLPSTYFDDCVPNRKATNKAFRNEADQARLWNFSLGQLQAYLGDSPHLNIDWEAVEAAKSKTSQVAAAQPSSTEDAPEAAAAAAASTPAQPEVPSEKEAEDKCEDSPQAQQEEEAPVKAVGENGGDEDGAGATTAATETEDSATGSDTAESPAAPAAPAAAVVGDGVESKQTEGDQDAAPATSVGDEKAADTPDAADA
ncbi:retinol dehydrogenase 12-like [Sycon ciliatum]|uniref:retinol dehydrogenase 12-like n=1 Tax=Sycon ciliatum TaxID=27933 RepID=UPI0031F6D983